MSNVKVKWKKTEICPLDLAILRIFARTVISAIVKEEGPPPGSSWSLKFWGSGDNSIWLGLGRRESSHYSNIPHSFKTFSSPRSAAHFIPRLVFSAFIHMLELPENVPLPKIVCLHPQHIGKIENSMYFTCMEN